MVKSALKMPIDDWDIGDIRPVCPRCGSENVVVEKDNEGHFCVLQCHKCGYRVKTCVEDNQ